MELWLGHFLSANLLAYGVKTIVDESVLIVLNNHTKK